MASRLFSHFKYDFLASIIVTFVALPLCLGIALASNAPLISGIIAGIVGGVVCGLASGSALGVSGPAAGLAAIVVSSIVTLGSWESFLLAGVVAGLFQLIAGFLRGGIIAYYFPSSVIKGMLAGIGIIIIIKQFPHLVGYDHALFSADHEATSAEIQYLTQAFYYINPGVVLISGLSLLLMLLWENVLAKKHVIFRIIQAPLAVVALGIGIHWLYQMGWGNFSLDSSELVKIPHFSNFEALKTHIALPDFSQLSNVKIYHTAIVIALIASLETLLCVEATDKLDPHKRITPTNRELKAQGLGNIVSCMLGGLPVTQVIVRSSANITFGARTKLSTILHGFFLFLCVALIPGVINQIPLSSLACILVVVGYKLAKPSLFKQVYSMGWGQFLPFFVTIVGIVFKDLLFGISIGFALSIFLILKHHYINSHETVLTSEKGNQTFRLHLAEELSFLNKARLLDELKNVPEGSSVIIDASRCKVMDPDVKEVIDNFRLSAPMQNINLQVIGV